jgi:SAM-dependent methyltransferase
VPTPHHPLHAALYDPMMGLVDRFGGLGDRRRHLIAEARGEVVEVGGGTGRNLSYYRPPDVDRVVVLEPDAAMRARLLEKVDGCAVPVEVHEAPVESSGLPDGFADTVVASLVLCSVDEPSVALAEIKRLLEPERGRLLFLEHVASPGLRGRVQSLATPVWKRTVAPGCHLDRPTLDLIRSAGFAITDCHRSGALVQGIAVPSKRPRPGAPS